MPEIPQGSPFEIKILQWPLQSSQVGWTRCRNGQSPQIINFVSDVFLLVQRRRHWRSRGFGRISRGWCSSALLFGNVGQYICEKNQRFFECVMVGFSYFDSVQLQSRASMLSAIFSFCCLELEDFRRWLQNLLCYCYYRHLLQIALDTTLFEDFRGSSKRPSRRFTYCLPFSLFFCGGVKVRFKASQNLIVAIIVWENGC